MHPRAAIYRERQRVKRREMVKQGLCRECGKPRNNDLIRCDDCHQNRLGVRIRTIRYDWIYRHPQYVSEWLDAWDAGERVVQIGIDYRTYQCVDREGWNIGLHS